MAKKFEIDDEKAVQLVEEKMNSISSVLQLKVTSDPTYTKAEEAMGLVREAKNFLKEKKASVLDPLKTAIENLKAIFEPAETKVSEIETHLKREIATYNVKLQEEEEIRMKEAKAKMEAGAPVEQAVKPLEKIQRKIEKIPTYTVYNVEIEDFAKVPNEYKMLDESKAKAAAKAGIKVDGLKFTKEEKIRNTF